MFISLLRGPGPWIDIIFFSVFSRLDGLPSLVQPYSLTRSPYVGPTRGTHVKPKTRHIPPEVGGKRKMKKALRRQMRRIPKNFSVLRSRTYSYAGCPALLSFSSPDAGFIRDRTNSSLGISPSIAQAQGTWSCRSHLFLNILLASNEGADTTYLISPSSKAHVYRSWFNYVMWSLIGNCLSLRCPVLPCPLLFGNCAYLLPVRRCSLVRVVLV